MAEDRTASPNVVYRAVLLASALVKVARIGHAAGGPGVESAAIVSAFHVPTLLETRVRRLVAGRALPPSGARRLAWSSAMLSVGISASLWLLGFSATLHSVTEAMVAYLP